MEELLPYYNRELAYLRELGGEFAQAFPKVAGRLRISDSESVDPFVERLMQSFAFLTARIQKRLDDDFPRVAEGLLQAILPQYLAPVPSMSVLRFELDRSEAQLVTGHRISRHTPVISEPVDGEVCEFRTAYDVQLWPIQLTAARLDPPPFGMAETHVPRTAQAVLRLTFETLSPETRFRDFTELDCLRLFLKGQRQFVHELYELIFNHAVGVLLGAGPAATGQSLPLRNLQPVGFAADEPVLPVSSQLPRSIQLLREYFAFPEKFLFFDITGLQKPLSDWDSGRLEINLFLDRRREELERHVSREMFQLGCTPIVNLFRETCEPIRLSEEQYEYPVVADARRPLAREIYSVDRVIANEGQGRQSELAPLYSLRHADAPERGRRFWLTERRPGRLIDEQLDGGTNVFLSLSNLELEHLTDSRTILTVETTCLNRDLPGRLVFGGGHPVFRLESAGPVGEIRCLLHPTPTRRPALQEGVLWRLVSSLSLNHLSIFGGPDAARTLRELLKVHDLVRALDDPFPFDGILSVDTQRVVSRITARSPIYTTGGTRSSEPGFARGIEITVELDEQKFVGVGMFLFASVLERFLALHCSVNSFTLLILRTKQRKEIRRWLPRTGETVL